MIGRAMVMLNRKGLRDVTNNIREFTYGGWQPFDKPGMFGVPVRRKSSSKTNDLTPVFREDGSVIAYVWKGQMGSQ